MNKKIIVLSTIFLATSALLIQVHAQSMMNYGNPSVTVAPTQIQQQLAEETQGKQFFDQLQSKQITCQKLTDSDFEKIGEYSMSQMFGNDTASHIAMNERIQQMHGVTGEEQMHIQIGKSITDCISAPISANEGGVSSMMGWNGFGMMNGNYGFGGVNIGYSVVVLIFEIIIAVDLILLGIWLWKQITKK